MHLGKKIPGGYLSVPTDWVVLRPQNLIYTSTLPSQRGEGVNIKSNVQTWSPKHLSVFILMPTCHWHLWFELWCLWRVSGHVCTLRAKRGEKCPISGLAWIEVLWYMKCNIVPNFVPAVGGVVEAAGRAPCR